MMQAAQGMMANMKPEDMKRMSDFAANMDPKVMEGMMKNMGGAANGMDPKQAAEQMKNMTPEQMRAGMAQAGTQMSAQKQYMYNASVMLKNDGNAHIKGERYTEALAAYNRALDNMKPHAGDDVTTLRHSLLLNSALCYLKLREFQKAIDACEQALSNNSTSVKAIFRRGLARFELGQLSEALTDVKQASALSPEDKTVAAELVRLREGCREAGLSDADITAAEKLAKERSSASASSSRAVASSSSAAASSSTSASVNPQMAEAMDRFSKNPEMLEQATEAMKNMSPEDIERMMKNAPLPPGMDAETARRQMEAVSKNPEMLKTAMAGLKSMPEEERRKILSRQGGDMSSLSKAFEDPEMMKQVAEMAKSMGGAPGMDPGEAATMQKAAQQLTENPDMLNQMSSMMKNMPPEQLQKMMELSSQMQGRRNQDGGSAGPPGPESMQSFMDDPEMMKAAEDMMKNMTPEMLTSMAKSSGFDLDEDKAKMFRRLMPVIPWVMKGMRFFGYAKKGVKKAFSPRGRIILAVVVVLIAVAQQYLW